MFEIPEKIYLVTPVWGGEYTRFFSELVVPNISRSDGIRKIFSEFDCKYLIYSDGISIEYLKGHPEIEFLRSLVEVQFIDNFNADDIEKYGRLTLSYNSGILRASSVGAALIFLNADMMYSSSTFSSLLRLIHQGKRSVEIEGFRVDKEPVECDLRANSTGFQVDARYLVELAMKYPQSISRSHFWEEYPEDGFMPFHTYWRVGDRGLLARASHIYPLYLYSRNASAGAAKTIDWDLVDTAKLHPEEMYIVRESDEIFSIECSNASYHITPTFKAPSLDEMREFVKQHCTPEHRRRLGVSIRFRKRSGGTIAWLFAEAKARVWYAGLAEDTCVVKIIFFFRKAKNEIDNIHKKIDYMINEILMSIYKFALRPSQRLFSSPTQKVFGKLGLSNFLLVPEDAVFQEFGQKTNFDPFMYRPIIESMSREKRRKERKSFLLMMLHADTDQLFDAAHQYYLDGNRNILPVESRVHYNCGESFAGNKWKLDDDNDQNKQWKLNKNDTAAIYVNLKSSGHYRIEIEFSRFDLKSLIKIFISSENKKLSIINFYNNLLTGSWVLCAILPINEILQKDGPISLYIGYEGSGDLIERETIKSISVYLIEPEAFGPLFDNSRSFSIYEQICRRDMKLTKMLDNCPFEVLSDAERATAWVSSLDAAIKMELDDSVWVYARNLLAIRGLSFEYYEELAKHDKDLGAYLANCPVTALTDRKRGDQWLQGLETIIRSNILPRNATELDGDRLYLSGMFVGFGWGNVTKWGEQSYRSFGAKNVALRIRHPEIGLSSLRIRTYIFSTIPEFLDLFKVKVNGILVESQVIWLTDRFAIQFTLEKDEDLAQDSCILIEYEIDHPLATRYFDCTSFTVLTIDTSHIALEPSENSTPEEMVVAERSV